MRINPLLLLLPCLLVPTFVHGQDAKVAPKATPKLATIDALAIKALAKFEAPGCSVAIVRNGEIVHLAGYGMCDLDDTAKLVTPDTLFAIASCTKAFTAAAVGALVDDGKMSWADPVAKHLRGFRLSDSLLDRSMTLRDLLAHTSSTIRHDVLWAVNTWDRKELIRRACLLQPDISIRSEWGYNNLQYVMAGEASAQAAKQSWEELIQRRLLDPLGMKRSVLTLKQFEASKDLARPHARQRETTGPLIRIKQRDNDTLAAAGGLYTSAREMTAWMRMLLNEGEFEGKRILKPTTIRAMFTPLATIPPDEDTARVFEGVTVQQAYGLGWFVQDYRGRRLIWHSGSIDGYRTLLLLLPKQKIGVFVTSNRNRDPVPEVVAYAALDEQLEIADKRDWVKLFQARAESLTKKATKREDELISKRKKGTKPTWTLKECTGTFEEPAHGTMTIRQESEKLLMQWGRLTLEMEHWHRDTWRLREPEGVWWGTLGDRLVTYRAGKSGEVEVLEFLGVQWQKGK
jgi:CubicO group peptidase (beta-lactamase class C family)